MISKFWAIDKDQVIKELKTGAILLGGNPATKQEIKNLQEEIKFIEKTRFWSIITNTVPDLAKKKMFEEAKCWEDMTYGKAMLKNIELIAAIMRTIRGIKV